MTKKINEKLYLTFRSLRHRNYRLFISGQCISLVGTWIQQLAMSWLIYSLTKSPLIMGVVMFAGSIPSLLISPFAGVLIDRINKYHAIIILQALFMIETFIIAVLTLLGVIQVWHIVLLNILMGVTFAFDMPLRQAFVVKLVEGSEDLGNAISLNSSTFNLARMVGPAIAGILIASFNEGICFMINSLSYIAVILALLAMKIKPESIDIRKEINVLGEFMEGVNYVASSKPMRNVIIYLGVSSLIGMSYPVLMPIFAKEILHGGPHTLGFLMSSSGLGALLGALNLAGRESFKGLEKLICFASLIFGFGLIGLSVLTNIWVSLALMFAIGYGMVVIIAACNTLVQHMVEDSKRGRVMSLFTMAFIGTSPVGNLVGGAIAQKAGVSNTFLLIGIAMIISVLIFSTKLKYFKEIKVEPNSLGQSHIS